MAAKTINKISEDKRRILSQKSPISLPDNPSNRGFLPSSIKNRFINYILDNKNSLFEEINRICDETNETIGDLEEELNEKFSSLESTINASLEVHDDLIYEIKEKLENFIDIEQELGESESKLLSQKAISNAITKSAVVIFDEDTKYTDFNGDGQSFIKLSKQSGTSEEEQGQEQEEEEQGQEEENQTQFRSSFFRSSNYVDLPVNNETNLNTNEELEETNLDLQPNTNLSLRKDLTASENLDETNLNLEGLVDFSIAGFND